MTFYCFGCGKRRPLTVSAGVSSSGKKVCADCVKKMESRSNPSSRSVKQRFLQNKQTTKLIQGNVDLYIKRLGGGRSIT